VIPIAKCFRTFTISVFTLQRVVPAPYDYHICLPGNLWPQCRAGLTDQYTLAVDLTFLAPVLVSKISDAIVMRITAADSAIFESEIRLPAMHILPCSHANSLLAGSSAYYRVHCIVPVTGTALFGFASMRVLIPIQTYLTKIFMIYVVSATAAYC
jgi:hypothetical protein